MSQAAWNARPGFDLSWNQNPKLPFHDLNYVLLKKLNICNLSRSLEQTLSFFIFFSLLIQ